MREHAVAETIGAHLALSSPTAELWRRVAHGELSAEEAAAAVLDGSTAASNEEREALERAKVVFAPVDPAQQDARLEQLLAQRRANEAVVPLAEPPARRNAGRRRGWAAGTVGVVVALAAVLLLWLRTSPSPRFAGEYSLELSGMTADVRGADPSPLPQGELPTFAMTGTIQVELRPEQNVAGPLAVVGFARADAGEAQPLSLEPVVHPSGKIDVDVPVRALGRAGTWTLIFVVGSPDHVPRSWDELDDGGDEGYVVLRSEVMVVPKPPRSGR